MPSVALARWASVAIVIVGCVACESQVSRTARDRAPDNVGAPAASATSVLLARADSMYRPSPDSAASLWRAALRLADSTGDSVSMARALTGLGQAARFRLAFKDARDFGERALALKLRLGMRSELFRSYNALGLLAWDEGRLTDALSLYRRASDAAAAVGDSSGIAKASINVGLAQQDLGDFGAARLSLSIGRAGAEAVGDSITLGRALTNIAALEIAMGDPLSALATIESARRLFHAVGDSIGEVNSIGQAATAYDALGEPQRAFAALDSALAMATRLGLKKEAAADLKILGDFFAAAGDHRRALEYYARATQETDSLGMPEERGNLLRNEARSHAALGRTDLARRFARDAQRLHAAGGFKEAELKDLLLLTDLADRDARRDEAAEWLASARRLASSLDGDLPTTRVSLAEARSADRAGDAERVLRVLSARRLALDLGGPAAVAEASALRMRAYARLGQLEAAAAAGRQAVNAFERIRSNYGSGELRTSFTADRAGVYADLVLVLLRLDRVTEAFAVADGARGRALIERISTARSQIRGTSPAAARGLEADSLLRAIDALVSRLTAEQRTPLRERGPVYMATTRELADRITEARTRYETLVARDPAEADAMVLLGSSTRTAADVQASLRPDEVMLEYLVTPARLIVFIVSRDSISTVSTGITADEIVNRTRLARDLMSRAVSTGDELPVLEGLHTALVQPVMRTGALRDARRLVIVRHSALAYLPFAALVDPATGRRLVERFAVSFVPSAAALPALRSVKTTAVAARAARTIAFAPLPDELPASRREVLAIADAFPGTITVIGPGATERALRSALAEQSVIHVATHGVMNMRNPLFSRLELAPSGGSSPGDNGRLETHELLGLRTTSRLVFLSGCETGVGEAWSSAFDLGEDYTTLGQSFLFAGARNVVATLWRIDDEGAAEFSRRFYGWLRTLPVPEALARAQVEMLSSGPRRSPYFWAAFEAMGDGR